VQRVTDQNETEDDIPTWTEGSPNQWQLHALHHHSRPTPKYKMARYHNHATKYLQ